MRRRRSARPREPPISVSKIHVYPRAYFEDLAAGKEGLDPLPPEVMRAIVHDWLVYMDAE